jgi:hypothetical protein
VRATRKYQGRNELCGKLRGVGAGSNQCTLKAESDIHILCWSFWTFRGLYSPQKISCKMLEGVLISSRSFTSYQYQYNEWVG